MSNVIEYQISKHFKNKGHFNKDTLRLFLADLDPEITESALDWRIYDLVRRNVIDQVKLDLYVISDKKIYTPYVADKLVRLSKIIAEEFDELEYCLWNTEWLNDFTRHQLGTYFYIIEVEKDFMEQVFNAYVESKQYKVFLNPKEEVMQRYVESEVSIIIKPLISRSPKQKLAIKESPEENLYIPTLEKILTDVYSDPITFYSVQGSEMNTIFENALTRYQINYSKLFSYAERRNKKREIKNYLNKVFNDHVKDILE